MERSFKLFKEPKGTEELGTKGVVVGVGIIEMINEVLQRWYLRSG